MAASTRGRLGWALVLAAGLLAGCANNRLPAGHPSLDSGAGHKAPRAPHSTQGGGWPLAVLADVEGDRVGVGVGERVRWFDARALRAAWAAAQRVGGVVPEARPEYLLIEDPAANAFALRQAGRDWIGINTGMVDLLGADEEAWGALLGHELAHLALQHGALQRTRQGETEGWVAVASVLLTAVGFPLTPLFAEMANSVADKGYSRADERAADEAGIDYMRRAGYDAAGAVRFFEKLAATGQSSRFTFLDTHPDGAERVAAARALAER